VKAVSWLSFNTFKYAKGERQLNNYSLFDSPTVAEAYRELVSQPYYLDEIDDVSPSQPVPVASSARLARQDLVSAYIRSYEQQPAVTFYLDKNAIAKFRGAGGYEFRLPRGVAKGIHALRVEVRDQAGRVAGSSTVSVFVE
jgi:hypothetical protein